MYSTKKIILLIGARLSALKSGKANVATTLAGYGITNAYTKTEADNLINPKYVKPETGIPVTDLVSTAQPFLADGGWISGSGLTFGSGFQATSDLFYRKVGNVVEIVGNIESTTNHARDSLHDIVQMPEGYRPANNFNDSGVVGVRYMATVMYGTSYVKAGWISYVADSTATDIVGGERVRLHLTYTV